MLRAILASAYGLAAAGAALLVIALRSRRGQVAPPRHRLPGRRESRPGSRCTPHGRDKSPAARSSLPLALNANRAPSP
jgi:hypothetical protein